MKNLLHYVLIFSLLMLPNTANASFIGGGSSGGGGGGITSINSDSSAAQTITSDSAGTDIAVATSSGVTTISVPSASAANRGVITTGAQTIAGVKTLSSAPVLSALTASKFVVTDGSKNLSSGSYSESDIVLTSTNQNVNGIKTLGSMPIFNSGVPSTVLMLDAGKSVTNSPTTSNEVGALHGLTASRVLGTDAGGLVTASGTSTTRLSYLDIDSSLVALLAAKVGSASPTFTGQINAPAGSAGSPGIHFNDATGNTGLYSGGTDVIAMSTAGVAKWFLLANGDVEEYGASGSAQTHTMYSTSTNGNFLGLDSSGGGGGTLYIKSSGSGETAALGVGTLYISGGTQSLKIKRSGDIGIGTGANSGLGGLLGLLSPSNNSVNGTTTVNASGSITLTSGKANEQLSPGDDIAVSSNTGKFCEVGSVGSATSVTLKAGCTLGDGTSQTVTRRRALLTMFDVNNSNTLVQRWANNGTHYSLTPGGSTASTMVMNVAALSASDKFFSFQETDGEAGNIVGVSDGTIAFNTFTGSHFTRVTRGNPAVWDLLCSDEGKPRFKQKGLDTFQGEQLQLFNTRVCDADDSSEVIGVYGGKDDNDHDMVLGLGTGRMRVTNTGLDVERGDFLTSSKVVGRAKLQMVNPVKKDSTYQNRTVAKATEAIHWQPGETERLISVIYLGG